MKIIVAGAGIGGLRAAALLAAKGHDITVYEKNTRDEVVHDWYEDVDYKLFTELNIPLPEGSYRTEPVSLIPPFTDNNIVIDVPQDARKWRISKKLFVNKLIEDAEKAGTKFEFSSPVKKVIIKGDRIGGVIVNKEKLYCDLVIDASGIESSVRKSIPEEFNITKELTDKDYFSVFRGIYDYYPDCVMPKQKKKIFVKFMGQPGFSRVICEPNGTVDILVGKMGRMSRFEFETLFRQLRIENQIIGYEDLQRGVFSKVPVRYPLTKAVANGYAAVGGSAFMTVPMMGSGISDAVRAGQMLAQAIIDGGNSSAKVLWKYQVAYFNKIGIERFGVDIMRRFLFSSKADEIRFLIEGGFLTRNDLKTVTEGKPLIASPKFLFDKFKIGKKKFRYYTEVYQALTNAKKAMELAKQIPNKFDDSRINSWQKKFEKYYK